MNKALIKRELEEIKNQALLLARRCDRASKAISVDDQPDSSLEDQLRRRREKLFKKNTAK